MNNKTSLIRRFFRKLGPGLITGVSDDDPSGIATYSQAGAQFGLATLWTSLLTFPLMYYIQEMCARIGIVTKEGLVTNIKKHYSPLILVFLVVLSLPAILLNIGANVAAVGASAHLIFPKISSYIFSLFFILVLAPSMVFFRYKQIVSLLKYLCLTLIVYFIIPFLVQQNLWEILKSTFIPTFKLNKDFFSILVAILGTTISPYLFFWQATMEAESKRKKRYLTVKRREMDDLEQDVGFGMFSSNLAMYFIILTTATTLFPAGIHHLSTIEDAAKALEPIAGTFSYILFSLGMIGTGLIAIPVLSGCLAYILSTVFNWQSGLDKKFYQVKSFYLIIILSLLSGFGIQVYGLSPIKALYYTAILYGLVAPFLILIILHLANNKKIMGKFVNSLQANIFGFITFLLMFISMIFLIYLQFFD